MPTLYKRGKYYWIKYSIQGTDHYASTKCTSKEDAKLVLEKKYYPLIANAHNRQNILPIQKPLFEALTEYRDRVLILSANGVKPKAASTIKRQQRNLDNFKEFLELRQINSFKGITEEVVQDYVQYYLPTECRKKQNTIYKDVQIFVNFLKWSVQKGYHFDNPAKDVVNRKPETTMPDFFSEEEVRQIFTEAKEPYKYMFQIMYYTGLRIQELLNLEWRDVLLDQKILLVRVRDGNKTKRETQIYLNKSVVQIFDKLSKEKQGKRWVFENMLGNQYAQSKVSGYALRLYRRLGVCLKSPLHIWRHTCASHLVIKKISLYIVRDILRHKSIRETEVYAKLSQEPIREAVEVLKL